MSQCFVHAVIGVLSVLFFLLAASSGITTLLILTRLKDSQPAFRQLLELRFKFGVIYLAVGTVLLLVAFVLGVSRGAGFGAKGVTSLILLAYATSLPFFARRNRKTMSIHMIVVAVLSLLNMLVGNVIFTGFHDFL